MCGSTTNWAIRMSLLSSCTPLFLSVCFAHCASHSRDMLSPLFSNYSFIFSSFFSPPLCSSVFFFFFFTYRKVDWFSPPFIFTLPLLPFFSLCFKNNCSLKAFNWYLINLFSWFPGLPKKQEQSRSAQRINFQNFVPEYLFN